ncbi:MAG: Ig-like domain-containing protein, partial [Clostridia bacterium]|nr:Ig-like domain-containing protein [Clostridia bacterium]
MNYRFNDNDDWLNPPAEFEYQPSWSLHNGYSMYDWSNYLEMSDRLALYAQVSFFAQYIFTQYGNTTYRQILTRLASGSSFDAAFQSATGQNTSEFVQNFRIAMTANTTPDLYDGIYGFMPQEGYDPANYHDVPNLYNLLAPVVFTGSSCSIKGGGAITVKPVDGVYYPPSGAGNLRYFGVSINAEPPEPVALTDISLDPASVSVYTGTAAMLTAVREPADANNFELEWTSSNPAVATVSGNNRRATVTGVSQGSATVTVRAHDLLNDLYYIASAAVTVLPMPTLEDALNVENGILTFDNTVSSYPWEVDMSDTLTRLAAKSTNEGANSSSSRFSLTVDMNAGDTMSFDWKVSSESNYDFLKFYVGSTETQRLSGSIDWNTITYTAPSSGTYTFSWEYTKDYSVNSGSDCGWVDNIFVPGYTQEPVAYIPGDVDMDGSVTVTDALIALRFAMGIVSLSDLQQEIGDMDADGTVTVTDALTILRIAMSII